MKVGIFGTGAYGMALASVLVENNIDVTMWTKFEQEKNDLIKNHGNDKLIPNFRLPSNIKITNDLVECAEEKELLIIVIPVAFIRDLCENLKTIYKKEQHICIASKGIEQETGLFIHEIVKEYFDTDNIAVISGPSFAKDVVAKKPIGLTLATNSMETKTIVHKALSNSYMKLRYSEDIIGTEICGSIKNIIAIASGMLEGLDCNLSTRAMLITEALHDMEEIIDIFGGVRRTVSSFAGFGDLLLTCTTTDSRNFSFGKLVGQKTDSKKLEEYLKTTTVEGYYTLESVQQLLKDKKEQVPIIKLIYHIVKQGGNPKELLTFLVEKD